MEAQVVAMQLRTERLPVDRAAHVRGVDPPTARAREHELAAVLANHCLGQRRDERRRNRHVALLVALRRQLDPAPVHAGFEARDIKPADSNAKTTRVRRPKKA